MLKERTRKGLEYANGGQNLKLNSKQKEEIINLHQQRKYAPELACC